MLTSESDNGPDIHVAVREGDGRVFFPRTQMNAGLDLWYPRLAAQYGGGAVLAWWNGYDALEEPILGANCDRVYTLRHRLQVATISRPPSLTPLPQAHIEEPTSSSSVTNR